MRKSEIVLSLILIILAAILGIMLSKALYADSPKVEEPKGDETFFKSDIIETGSLQITDEKGYCRIMISARGKGAPGISLIDGEMNRRIKIGIGDGQPFINLYDDNDNIRVQTFLTKDGSPAIRFYDQFKAIDYSLPLLPQHRKDGRKWPD